ncbi:MAG: hypothetical protein E7E15_08110 [Terrisporobacter othiniensis]|uniref:hypothetical protein n=1 Tax=Terrisporobacter othiniensis TaxID=1577792 RepID=UPI002903ABB5|nr:hypothetical protein [Terrisporobacter othiniensis]MDU2201016.1 hypothetical protein [Terrisporobacter othiniensis]
MDASLNKTILKKLSEKTKNDPGQKEFIINILREEASGLGWFKEKYEKELEKYIEREK